LKNKIIGFAFIATMFLGLAGQSFASDKVSDEEKNSMLKLSQTKQDFVDCLKKELKKSNANSKIEPPAYVLYAYQYKLGRIKSSEIIDKKQADNIINTCRQCIKEIEKKEAEKKEAEKKEVEKRRQKKKR